jgi:nucleotide-binding universal stress UspA family protein
MKVLVPTDGSEHSMKAVNSALMMAENENADVTLMSVALYVEGDFDEMPMNIQEKLEAHAQAALAKAKALFDQKGIQVKTVLEVGVVPANNILRKAETDKYDHIVMGSSGVGTLKKFFMGSTAAKVVAYAPCSVTIMR